MWSLIRIGPEPAKTKIWLAKETDISHKRNV